jgi:hypothetical protein
LTLWQWYFRKYDDHGGLTSNVCVIYVCYMMKDPTVDRGPRQLRRRIRFSGTTRRPGHPLRPFIISIISPFLSMGIPLLLMCEVTYIYVYVLGILLFDKLYIYIYIYALINSPNYLIIRYSPTYIATDISYNHVSTGSHTYPLSCIIIYFVGTYIVYIYKDAVFF